MNQYNNTDVKVPPKKRPCPVCRTEEKIDVWHTDKAPTILRPLDRDTINRLRHIQFPEQLPLAYAMCRTCTHITMVLSVKKELTRMIYSDLYTSFAGKMHSGICRTYADQFLDYFLKTILKKQGQETTCLEIGCHDGYLLKKLEEKGLTMVGCDPASGSNIAIQEGLTVVQQFFSHDLFNHQSFDYVISRQVIEHIDTPKRFLDHITKVLKKDGTLVIETPDPLFYITRGNLNPFHIEHLNLYTSISLPLLCEKADFSIESITPLGKNLILTAKKESRQSKTPATGTTISAMAVNDILSKTKAFTENLQASRNKIQAVIARHSHANGSICIWGAGGFCASLLSQFFDGLDPLIIDSDVKKQDLMFYHGHHSPVKPIETLSKSNVSLLIIASEYYQEILSDIKLRNLQIPEILLIFPEVTLAHH